MKMFGKVALTFVVLAVSAFAADKSTKVRFDVSQPITVAGTTLQTGSYEMVVDQTGTNAKVAIKRGSKVVVDTTATLRDDASAGDVSFALDEGRNLKELRSKKFHGAVVFTPAESTQAKGGQ